jgi:multimeric flavodoxin WrbA
MGNPLKILNIYGSYIYGSSAAIANRFLKKAGSLGAEIQSFELDMLHITKCKNCLSCKTVIDRCIIQDDITMLFNLLARCDVLVLSTGIYNSQVTWNMMILEGRFFSLLKPDYETNPDASRLPPGKKLVFIQTQTAARDKYVDIYQRYEALFRKLGFCDVFVIHAYQFTKPGDLDSRTDIMKLADEIAEKVTRC